MMECTRLMSNRSNKPTDISCLPGVVSSTSDHQLDYTNHYNMSIPDNMETLVAAALNEVPVKERDEALHDIHGVSEKFEEDKDELAAKLEDMNQELAKIKSKQAYDKAESLSKSYVSDPKLRLKFLRSERHNTKRAAYRMVLHFDRKLDLFGEDCLVRDIKLSDLDPEEVRKFQSSYFQMLPQRDCVGRPILCMVRTVARHPSEVRTRQRFFWYVSMVAAEIEDSQSKGVVSVWYYAIDPQSLHTGSRSNAAQTIELTNAVPLRHAAIHICYDNPALRSHLSFDALNMDNSLRIRVKYHFGSNLEVQHALSTFGIPRSVLPLDRLGGASFDNHKAWVEQRLKREAPTEAHIEAHSKTTKYIAMPGPYDVLLGRGKVIEESPGNLRFRNMIETTGNRYDAAPRFDKVVVAQSILSRIREAGGRFLKHQEEGWVEVDDGTAREKVCHAFRNHRNRPSRPRRSSFQGFLTTPI